MELLYRHASLSQREIGELMGLDYSSVSVARKKLRDALTTDKRLMRQFNAVEGAFIQE